MKLWVLAENAACREDLTAEHGLSLYLETGGRKILFDAGQSGAFAHNGAAMGVDLRQVDLAVLSHGHYDHGGGLLRFLELNDHAPVYLSRHAFAACHNGEGKYIGLDQALAQSDRLRPVEGQYALDDGLTLFGAEGLPPEESFGLTVLENGQFRPDDFCHEQYLLVEEQGVRILLSGCSHRGILQIVDRFRPHVLIGGFHFMKLDPEGEGRAKLEAAAEALLQGETVYYTGHCTGAAQFAFLKARMGDRLHAIPTGTVLEIPG